MGLNYEITVLLSKFSSKVALLFWFELLKK
jgi:hypothetical protein